MVWLVIVICIYYRKRHLHSKIFFRNCFIKPRAYKRRPLSLALAVFKCSAAYFELGSLQLRQNLLQGMPMLSACTPTRQCPSVLWRQPRVCVYFPCSLVFQICLVILNDPVELHLFLALKFLISLIVIMISLCEAPKSNARNTFCAESSHSNMLCSYALKPILG